ncbi:MAG TPA: LytTR family DNA-binding domain-containing protein [Burkholderiales bacterium]|nr:LytTR family DNA-binding domain-containing protein [Burkholderiales bacterium]
MSPRALIAEDEPLLAARLKAMLAEAWPELEIVHVAASGSEALDKLLALAPDVALLDIRMPGLTGLEVAEELADRLAPGARPPALVFVTAYDEFALEAFDLAAVDYLLKPVGAERLARCVARLKAALTQPPGLEALLAQLRAVSAPPPAAEPLRHIRAGIGNAVRIIALEDVCYFRAGDKYTAVATRDGAEALIRIPLKELLARLPAGRFRQVHRGSIVNMDQVAEALRDDAGRVTLRLKHRKETLPVSRLYAELFRQM